MEIKKIMIVALAPWCLLFLFIQGCEITGLAASRFISAETQIVIHAQSTDEFNDSNEHVLPQLVQQESATATDTVHTIHEDAGITSIMDARTIRLNKPYSLKE